MNGNEQQKLRARTLVLYAEDAVRQAGLDLAKAEVKFAKARRELAEAQRHAKKVNGR